MLVLGAVSYERGTPVLDRSSTIPLHNLKIALSLFPSITQGCWCSELTMLDLSNNRLPTVPLEMHHLTNLTHLNLKHNVLQLPLQVPSWV